MSYRILITDELSAEGLAYLEGAEDVAYDLVTGLSSAELVEKIKGYDGLIVRSSVKVTEAVLQAADQLKVVGRAGAGVDNIEVGVASKRGVVVMNTPGANTIATAEHTLAMLLAMCRHIPQAQASLKAGRWERSSFIGSQLYRKTIGIIGMGRIGSRVAQRCQAFNMEVIAHDPYLSDEVARELKVKRVDLAELLAKSDFITLHAALTPTTEKLINAETIAQMKPGVRLLNIARGGLVDEAALIAGLQSGQIAGVALDVFAQEPLAPDSPLLEL
jgi:D-3-phosphoglycerate dehydrogenase